MYTYFLSVHKYSLLYIHICLLDHTYNNMIYINIIDIACILMRIQISLAI